MHVIQSKIRLRFNQIDKKKYLSQINETVKNEQLISVGMTVYPDNNLISNLDYSKINQI